MIAPISNNTRTIMTALRLGREGRSSEDLISSSHSCNHHVGVFDDYLKHCHESCSRYSDWDRLLFACQQNKLDVVQHLIEEGGVDPSYSNPMKQSALHIAARYGHVQCLEYLLQRIPSEQRVVAVNAKNRLSGATPLHCCLQRTVKGDSDEELRSRLMAGVLLLVQAGADMSIPDLTGKTPLDYWKQNFEHGARDGEVSHFLGQEFKSKVTV
jgi:ankyrin repeat protein